ncbi:MAG TPA: SCO family protein [Rhodocyclaceae bacterium]|nr:SCO family protein [Rhodocyclaceae bacterium]
MAWRHLRSAAPVAPPSAATLIDDARPLPPFTLRRVGGTLGNADLAGHWTLLDFGYTFCPDICPTTLAALKDVKARLVATGIAPPRVIFVSVDPARDTPERLNDYVRFFDPDFLGATGDDAALAPLAQNLGVHYQRLDERDKQHYTVDHSAAVYLIDPRGRLRATFSWPHDPAAIAADYRRLTGG